MLPLPTLMFPLSLPNPPIGFGFPVNFICPEFRRFIIDNIYSDGLSTPLPIDSGDQFLVRDPKG